MEVGSGYLKVVYEACERTVTQTKAVLAHAYTTASSNATDAGAPEQNGHAPNGYEGGKP
jgi:hypothetical protein